MLTKSAPVRVKAVGEDDGLEAGVFEAIVSVFGNVDSYGDRVLKGAFTDTLEAWAASGDPIPVYWSHRMDDPDYNLGHVLEAEERDEGLWVKGQLDLDNPKAAQTYRLLKGRRVTQFSFAYEVQAYTIKSEQGVGEVWELERLKLYEVGPTPVGVNQETELLTVKAAGHTATRMALDIKAGRVLSSKNEGDLREAHEAIGRVLATLENVDDGKASVTPTSKDEEPPAAKSEDSPGQASASLRLRIDLAAAELPGDINPEGK